MSSPHHTARRILFWTLVVVYVCAAGVIIPHAFGYRFSMDRGVFVYAGSITVKTNPLLVNITVDGAPTDAERNFINRSYHLTGLTPGTHTVTVTADGYQTYEKRIDVSSGRSTELWNVLLPRTTYEITTLTQQPLAGFFRSPDNAWVALPGMTNGSLTITLTDPEDGTSTTTHAVAVPPALRTATPDTANTEWRPDSRALLVPVTMSSPDTATDMTDAVVIMLDNAGTATGTASLRAILPSPVGTITALRWDPREKTVFYALLDETLTRITLTIGNTGTMTATTSPVASHVLTYTIASDMLYYLTTDTGMVFRTTTGTTEDVVSTQITASPLLMDGGATMTVYGDDALPRIAIRALRGGTLYLFDAFTADGSPLRRIADGTTGFLFSDDGKKLLYWTRTDIAVYFTRDWDVQPERRRGETVTVAHFTDPIDNVQWHRDYEHVLYTVDGTLRVTELDNRGGRATQTIATVGTGSIVRADHADNRLYTATLTDGTDRHTLSFIDFPEPENTFFQ